LAHVTTRLFRSQEVAFRATLELVALPVYRHARPVLSIVIVAFRVSAFCDNVNVPAKSIHMKLKEGPFRALTGEWTFKALAENACKVELVLTYAFGTSLLETAIGPVFDRIGRTFIDAFVQRAEKLHARKAR